MPWLCPRRLHLALQEHGSPLNTDPRRPYLKACSGSPRCAHMGTGRSYIPTYAFSLEEPHSSARPLQPRYPPCSSTPHHHCPPRSKWSEAARSSVCCIGCRTACRTQHRLSGVWGQPGTERENYISICRTLMGLQMAMFYLFFSTCKEKGRH